MSNWVDNFSNCSQYTQNNYSQYPMMPAAMRYGCGFESRTKSPDFLCYEGAYSPLGINQLSSSVACYKRSDAHSPVIKLRPWEYQQEDELDNSQEMNESNNNIKRSLRSKLNSNSKAFVLKKSVKRDSSNRKTSQDTKAQSDEDGNSTDGSLDINPDVYYNRQFRKSSDSSAAGEAIINGKLINSEEKSSQAKFKTELCKNWQAGNCKFGSKCFFAHGVEELAEKKNLPSNYKTKIWKQFHEELYCSYGSRCQFIHLDNEEEVQENTLCSAIYSLAGLRPSKKANKDRLSVFKSLTN